MVYRDDSAAQQARLRALEREAALVGRLEKRVRELEAENQRLRDGRAAEVRQLDPNPISNNADANSVYVDAKISEYIERIINATRPTAQPIGDVANHVLSGASLELATSVEAAAKQLAHSRDRRYVVPEYVKLVARELLPEQLILTSDAETAGITAAGIVDSILEIIKIP